LKARVSTLIADEMARIDEALAITLGLPSSYAIQRVTAWDARAP